jgi:hypothetical protein
MKKIYNFLFGRIIRWKEKKKMEKIYKKRLEELRKRDPFIYKNH